MPTSTAIQQAAQRIRKGTDLLSAMAKVKQASRQALRTGATTELQAAGYHVFSLDATAL